VLVCPHVKDHKTNTNFIQTSRIFELRKTKDRQKKPRYVEECLEAKHSDNDSGPRRETSAPKPPVAAQLLTLLTKASSSIRYGTNAQNDRRRSLIVISEDDELKKLPLDSPESVQSKSNLQEVLSDKCDGMDDQECEFESEEDCFEERWVPNDEDFEANVLRATGNDFALAARLIPQLYGMFEEEESPVVGFWEAGYRKYAGNFSGYASGMSGGVFNPFGSYTGQRTNRKKRQRGNDEDNGEGSSNNQDGDGDGDGGNAEGSATSGSATHPLACPFNKKYSSKYNGSYKPLNGKRGVYKSCSLGFPDYQRFRYALEFPTSRTSTDIPREHLLRVHRWVQCEKCPLLITAPQDDRQLAYQTHRFNPAGCDNTPPVVSEGITELQWAQIDDFQKKSRSEATSRKLQLNVVKWNNVWKVLFPDHEGDPPHPCELHSSPDKFRYMLTFSGYDANVNTVEQPSFLDMQEEVKEFERFYAIETMELYSPLELQNAVAAFQVWFVKRWLERLKRPVMQQTQQQMPQATLGEYPETQTAYPSWEEEQLNPPSLLPTGTSTQRRAGIERSSSHQEPLQQYSNAREALDLPSHTQRNGSDPGPGYRMSGYMAVAPHPGTAQGGPDSTLLPMSSQQNKHQTEYINPSIIYAGDGPLSIPYSESQGLAQGYRNAVSKEYGASRGLSNQPVDHIPYNYSTGCDINRAPQSQQTNPAPLPPTHNPRSSGTSSVYPPEAYGPSSATTYNQRLAHPPQQSPQGTLSNPKLHPQRSFPVRTTSDPNPNAAQTP
jgi:hypothetical protein